MRLIDADALKERWTIASPEPYNTDAAEVLDSIDKALTIETEPVKSGRWVLCGISIICSVCNKASSTDSNFCPNCGTDMRNEVGVKG